MKQLYLLILTLLAACIVQAAEPLQVVATVPDLGDLVARIGGDEVEVTVLVKGPEDPHFLQARPSLIKAVSQADLFVMVGLELEAGWAPVLLRSSRNGAIQPGQPGYLDASTAIVPLHDHSGLVDRSAGHVHAMGNPHYLLDPINGLRVAELICDRLTALRPTGTERFHERCDAFRGELGRRLVGQYLAEKYDIGKLAAVFSQGKLEAFLEQTGERDKLGGWLGQLVPEGRIQAIDDHAMWTYFAKRFRIEILAHLEPKPGLTPTTRHLASVVETVEKEAVPVILTAAYFPARHAQFVSQRTGAVTLAMCHQVQGRPEADTYLEMIDYNVTTLVGALQR